MTVMRRRCPGDGVVRSASTFEVSMTTGPLQEVRFAVVLYGGVSLAIYINGVTQELLRLVRASALPEGDLQHSERVYRKLAAVLAPGIVPTSATATEGEIRTRFVIDIVSGTSAGGINGIFLAKALANNTKMDALQDLWFNEGDIAKLLNDRRSYADIGLRPGPPESLLNSQRMYSKLLTALDVMDGNAGVAAALQSPHADRIDVYATTTDIEGIPVPVPLADNVVFERRHRNAFHFRFIKDERNDFQPLNNPFLAFSARCTSSFPFAFEPMQLASVDEVLTRHRVWSERKFCHAGSSRWQRYFTNYLHGVLPGATPFVDRSFGDGGYLNNAPFSHAVDALLMRQADVPVDRKLVYVEPSPAHPEEAAAARRPNAVENSLAALVEIPGYQTIRNDLNRVLDRNAAVARVNRTVAEVEARIQAAGDACPDGPLEEIWFHPDSCYQAYYQMRAGEVTDLLATMVARTRGIEEDSAHFRALRAVVRSWREDEYHVDPRTAGAETSTAGVRRFLEDFDLPYRMRRLRFVIRKLDQLLALDSPNETMRRDAEATARFGSTLSAGKPVPPIRTADVFEVRARYSRAYTEDLKFVFDHVLGIPDPDDSDTPEDLRGKPHANPAKLVRDVLPERSEILALLNAMIGLADNAGPGPKRTTVTDASETAEPRPSRRVTLSTTKTVRWESDPVDAEELYGKRLREYRATAVSARAEGGQSTAIGEPPTSVQSKLRVAGQHLAELLRPPLERAHQAAVPGERATEADEIARRYYRCFDLFDAVQYPMTFGTDVGEADVVEIIRVSPEDAPALVDDVAGRRAKLKGLAIAHFGAFLDQDWRVSDLLWGRLDAAERLISSLLPHQESDALRRGLIVEAHEAILVEFGAQARLGEMAVRQATGRTPEGPLPTGRVNALIAAVVPPLTLGTPGAQKQFMQLWQDVVPASPDRTLLARSLARGSSIVGRILDKIGDDSGLGSPGTWLTRAGRALWGLVEVSVPRSFGEFLGGYWQQLFAAVAAIMVVMGVLTNTVPVVTAGMTLFGIVAVFFAARTILRRFLQRGEVRRLVIGLFALAVVVLCALGLLLVVAWITGAPAWLVRTLPPGLEP
jgi:patatin-related protein